MLSPSVSRPAVSFYRAGLPGQVLLNAAEDAGP
jgi:hypothetical protein